MGLYSKIDQRIHNYYEVLTENKSLSKQIFYLKVGVLILLYFNVFMIIKEKIVTMKLLLQTSLYQSENL